MFLHISVLRHSSHLPTKNHSSLRCGWVDGKHLRPLKVINEIHPCKLLIHPYRADELGHWLHHQVPNAAIPKPSRPPPAKAFL